MLRLVFRWIEQPKSCLWKNKIQRKSVYAIGKNKRDSADFLYKCDSIFKMAFKIIFICKFMVWDFFYVPCKVNVKQNLFKNDGISNCSTNGRFKAEIPSPRML